MSSPTENWEKRDGAANGAGKVLDLEGTTFGGPGTTHIRKVDDESTPMRKSGAEPIFPSVARRNGWDLGCFASLSFGFLRH